MPTDAGKFYKTQIKAGFQQHAEEDDPERLQQIIDRALQDADWIIKKVKTKPYIVWFEIFDTDSYKKYIFRF